MNTAYLVLGAIGSGKSVIADILLSGQHLRGVEYISADIYKQKYFNIPISMDKRGYRAADELAFCRIIEVCKAGSDFVHEFCPTNVNKIRTLKRILSKYGYVIIGLFVGTDDASINLGRCQRREQSGADVVSENKIRGRYAVALEQIMDIVEVSSQMYFIDNTTDVPRILALFTGNTLEVWDCNCRWFNVSIQPRISIT